MSCIHCLHCQQAAALSDLRLPAPGSSTFYVRFAEVYRLARARSSQPGRLVREANPGLTLEQVKWYRRRCVQLQLLPRVRETGEVAAVTEAPTVTLHPDLAMALTFGTPLTVELVQAVTPHKVPGRAREYLDQLVAAGLVDAPAT